MISGTVRGWSPRMRTESWERFGAQTRKRTRPPSSTLAPNSSCHPPRLGVPNGGPSCPGLFGIPGILDWLGCGRIRANQKRDRQMRKGFGNRDDEIAIAADRGNGAAGEEVPIGARGELLSQADLGVTPSFKSDG